MAGSKLNSYDSFGFKPGRLLAGKYLVQARLGAGVEGEVYRVTEARTGIERAAKVFFPEQNVRDRAVRFYANKLNRLRDCPIVIQYHHAEAVRHQGEAVTCLISDLVEGQILADFVKSQPRRRLGTFEGMHMLHALSRGLEQIHRVRDYHGDIHETNVLISRSGINFKVKLLDFHHHGPPSAYQMREDVIQLVRLFYDALGGRARYANQPPEVKAICRGLRGDLIAKSFPTAGKLRQHLESFEWG